MTLFHWANQTLYIPSSTATSFYLEEPACQPLGHPSPSDSGVIPSFKMLN